jgi:hypothetical protein
MLYVLTFFENKKILFCCKFVFYWRNSEFFDFFDFSENAEKKNYFVVKRH